MTTAYEELESAWKREFHSPELQPLRQGFFKDLSAYVKRLRDTQHSLDARSLKAVVLEDEFLRLERLLSQLLDRRLDKLWSRGETIQSASLETAEQQFHTTLTALRMDYTKLKQDTLHGRELTIQRSKTRSSGIIRFEKDVPSIIGVDLKTHGPFHKEDVARLPIENAESLVRQGAAIEITTSSQDNG